MKSRFHVKARFVEREAAEPTWKAIHRAADANVGLLAATFPASVAFLRENVNQAEVLLALKRNNPGTAIAAFPWDEWARLFDRLVTPRILETMRAGGEAAGRVTTIEKQRTTLQGVFDLMNPRAQRIAAMIAASAVTSVSAATMQAMRDIIAEAQGAGISVRDQAASIERILIETAGLDSQRAQTLLRFENAQIARGISEEIVRQRVSDLRDRMLMDRAMVIARTECLTPDTLVDRAVVRAVFRRWYSGEVIEIRTANGRKLTATPNHPMLTRRGWIAASLVDPSDELICDGRQQNHSTSGHPDDIANPTTIGEIFDSLKLVSIRERVPTSHDDFHGDGSDQSEVDVLRPDRLLRIGDFAALNQPLLQDILTPAGKAATRFCECQALLGLNETQCFCMSTQLDTSFLQYAGDRVVADSMSFAERADSFPRHVSIGDLLSRKSANVVVWAPASAEERIPSIGMRSSQPGSLYDFADPFGTSSHLSGYEHIAEASFIELDSVESVGLRSFSGHVYNLETPNGYFAANGVYTGNTIDAANAGQVELWNQAREAGEIPFGMLKEWIATPDKRICKICESLDDQKVPLAESFVDLNGQHHERPTAHPQCRCSLALVEPEEE